jgi:hypothetical protein
MDIPSVWHQERETLPFLTIITQMGHDIHETVKEYWSTTEHFISSSPDKMTRHDRCLHILRHLHIWNNGNALDNNDPNYGQLRHIF